MNEILTEAPKGVGAIVQFTTSSGEKIILIKLAGNGTELYSYRGENANYRWDCIKDLNPIILHEGYIPRPPVPEPKIYGVVRGVCGNSRVKRITVFVRMRPASASWSCVDCPCGYVYHFWAYIDNPEVLFEGVGE